MFGFCPDRVRSPLSSVSAVLWISVVRVVVGDNSGGRGSDDLPGGGTVHAL